MKIVLKRKNGNIEFYNKNQKHIEDILAKENAQDLTAEFSVFVKNFEPKVKFLDLLNEKFSSWKQTDYNYYVEKYITEPAMVAFLKLKTN